jgi:outer membrane protein
MKFAVAGTLAVLAALTLGTAAPAVAQATPAGTKIAFVNSQRILRETPGYAQEETTFTKELAGFRNEVQQLQAKLDSAAADFQQQGTLLSPTAREAKRKQLETQQADLEQKTQDLQQRAASRERELLDPIQNRVSAVVEQIRSAGGYAMIFDVGTPGTSVVAADKTLDLSDRVIAQLKSGK